MNPNVDLIFKYIKKLLIWLVAPLTFVIFIFFLGEQYEVGRLAAIASCEGSVNTPACIRSKGYLAGEPYYPDLGRRYIGAFARMVGGDLGASYRVEPKLPPLGAPKAAADGQEEDEDLKDLPPEKAKVEPPPAKAPAKK